MTFVVTTAPKELDYCRDDVFEEPGGHAPDERVADTWLREGYRGNRFTGYHLLATTLFLKERCAWSGSGQKTALSTSEDTSRPLSDLPLKSGARRRQTLNFAKL